jgi:hypothetical protein
MTKLWLAAVVALGACSGSTGSTNDGGADMHHGAEVCTPDGQNVALTGQYGVQASLLVNVKVTPGCSGASCIVDTDANAELLLLATIATSGTTANVMNVQPCKIVIPPVALKGQMMPLTLSAPKALVASVKPVSSVGTLSGTMTCANFNAQPITLALGANLKNPATDMLPQFTQGGTPEIPLCGNMVTTACLTKTTPAPTDFECVCDQDADGKPGATLNAANVPGLADLDEVYVDLRTSVTLAGQVFPQAAGQTNPGQRIQGKVTGLALDTSVLGCHHSMPPSDCTDSDTGTAAALNPAVTQSVNGDSTFTAVPLSASDTCDTLIANETALFPQ